MTDTDDSDDQEPFTNTPAKAESLLHSLEQATGVNVNANKTETWVQSQVELYQRLKKWYLISPCLTLSIIRYGSRVKWSN